MTNRPARKSADQMALFPDAQTDLFGAAPVVEVYVPNPEHVRNAARAALENFREMTSWTSVNPVIRRMHIRKAVYCYEMTADDAEALEWRRRYEAEFARLDALGKRVTDEERRTWILRYPPEAFDPVWRPRG